MNMNGKLDKLNSAKNDRNNEYYTKYEDVDFYVQNTQIKDYLKDKIVYLPCDTENSEIYRYLINNKDVLHIKEILYTSDDYYGHLDLYKKCDVVFTNPPFTGIIKWIKWLNTNNLKYILWFPQMQTISMTLEELKGKTILCHDNSGSRIQYGNNKLLKKSKDYRMFNTPDGEKSVAIYLISNDDYFDNLLYVGPAFQYSFDEIKGKLFLTDENIYEVNNAKYIPNDYYDYLYIPVTAYIIRKDMFECFEIKDVVCKDGKERARVLVKLKQNK